MWGKKDDRRASGEAEDARGGDPSPDDPPAHWSIDFWVDDVDATADAAARLGGRVIAPPYDIPDIGFRQAVLADPHGAAFSVSKVGAGG